MGRIPTEEIDTVLTDESIFLVGFMVDGHRTYVEVTRNWAEKLIRDHGKDSFDWYRLRRFIFIDTK